MENIADLLTNNSAILITAAVLLYAVVAHGPAFVEWVTGRVDTEVIYETLKPFVMSAIMKAYQISEATVDAGQERLMGEEKLSVAIAFYDELPAPIQLLIDKEDWGALVQQVFNSINAQIDAGQDWMSGVGAS